MAKPRHGRSPRRALLLSGGIGDYLHYLTWIPGYLSELGSGISELVVVVESTVPGQVERLFARAFPELRFEFVPAAFHWTKTNPLLIPTSASERKQRAAYRYLEERKLEITDWFLPFCCHGTVRDMAPLLRVVGARPATVAPSMVVSLRDKGFLWWPDRELLEEIEKRTPGWKTDYYGTPTESIEGFARMTTAADAAEALSASYWADLFVGTDTGLATIRELTGRKVIYCINEYWLWESMVRYKYLDPAHTSSEFAFDRERLLRLVSQHTQSSNGNGLAREKFQRDSQEPRPHARVGVVKSRLPRKAAHP